MLARFLIIATQFILVIIALIPPGFTTGIIIAAIVLLLQIPYLGSLAIIPYIYCTNFLIFLGLAKKDKAWCVVYDSVSKLPIDPAYVTVRNMQGKEVSSIITDLSGRFALLLPRGLYTIEASKTNYAFPSQKLLGSQTDGKYNNLYFGAVFEIKDEERSVGISIPMDPIQEDWNQVEKKRKKLFYRFDDATTYFRGARTYTTLALLLTLTRAIYEHTPMSLYRIAIAFIILIVVILFSRRFRQYAHSFVLDKDTALPVPFAKVCIFSAKSNNKITQKITSFEGQFTCLLSKGTYYATIEKRNEHGGYELVYTSDPFSVNDGYIGKRFNV